MAQLPVRATEILGDKSQLPLYRKQFEETKPDVVVNMVAYTRADAELFVSTFQGLCGRAVVISSADVYLAYGRLHGTEPGPPEPVPLHEGSPLRQQLGLGGAGYDKLSVESVIRNAAAFDLTVIRYPAIYGPGDRQRRFFYYARRMADGRPYILLRQSESAFCWTHAYSENAAHAVVLAVTSELASGRTFNVAEEHVPSWGDRLTQFAQAAGWTGEIHLVPDELFPEQLLPDNLRSIPNFQRMPDLSQQYVLDDRLIRTELGYKERVSLEDGLQQTLRWILQHPPEIDETKFDYALEDRIVSGLSLGS
jgi:nucleoside-diphosphate-sugar epimerase